MTDNEPTLKDVFDFITTLSRDDLTHLIELAIEVMNRETDADHGATVNPQTSRDHNDDDIRKSDSLSMHLIREIVIKEAKDAIELRDISSIERNVLRDSLRDFEESFQVLTDGTITSRRDLHVVLTLLQSAFTIGALGKIPSDKRLILFEQFKSEHTSEANKARRGAGDVIQNMIERLAVGEWKRHPMFTKSNLRTAKAIRKSLNNELITLKSTGSIIKGWKPVDESDTAAVERQIGAIAKRIKRVPRPDN